MLTVVLVGLSLVHSRLVESMTISVFIKFRFAILYSGTTIDDGNKSERSIFVASISCVPI